MTIDECLEQISGRLSFGITEVTIQGGLDARTSTHFYYTLVREIKQAFPNLHIHAFSPEEYVPAAQLSARIEREGLKPFERTTLYELRS